MTSLPYLSRKSKFNRHHAIGHKHTQTRESSYKILECKLVSDHWRTRKYREETGRLQARWQFEQSAPPATHSDREPEPLRQCSHNQDPSWRGCTAPWQKSLQGNVMWLLQMHHHQVQWYQRSWRVRILFLRLKFKLSNTRTQQKAKAQLDIGIPHEEIWFRSKAGFCWFLYLANCWCWLYGYWCVSLSVLASHGSCVPSCVRTAEMAARPVQHLQINVQLCIHGNSTNYVEISK